MVDFVIICQTEKWATAHAGVLHILSLPNHSAITWFTNGGTQFKKDGTDTLGFEDAILIHWYELWKIGISELSRNKPWG